MRRKRMRGESEYLRAVAYRQFGEREIWQGRKASSYLPLLLLHCMDYTHTPIYAALRDRGEAAKSLSTRHRVNGIHKQIYMYINAAQEFNSESHTALFLGLFAKWVVVAINLRFSPSFFCNPVAALESNTKEDY